MRILHTLLLVLVSAVSLLDLGFWTHKQGMSMTISFGQDKHSAKQESASVADHAGYVGICFARNKIMDVFAESPAEKAGIAVGDKILDIDGKSTYGMDGHGMFDLMTGPIGTSVDVILERGDEQQKRSLVRAAIVPDELLRETQIRQMLMNRQSNKVDQSDDAKE